jgi:hypothetical protein
MVEENPKRKIKVPKGVDFLTSAQFAEEFGFKGGARQVGELARKGKLPGYPVPSGGRLRWFIKVSEYKDQLEAKTKAPLSPENMEFRKRIAAAKEEYAGLTPQQKQGRQGWQRIFSKHMSSQDPELKKAIDEAMASLPAGTNYKIKNRVRAGVRSKWQREHKKA